MTRKGMSIRFNLSDVRPMGRSAMGVIGMKLADGDEVVSMMTENQGSHVLFISEKGLGKLTPITEFKTQHRDGSGVKCYKITEKSGDLVGARAVCQDDDVLLITTEGIVMRTPCSYISVLGRITTGVKVMDLKDGVKVASFSKVKRDPEEPGEDGGEESDENEEGINHPDHG